MFLNTRAAFDKLLRDIKKFCYSVEILLNTAYILSMVNAIVKGNGNLPLNIVFLSLAVLYFVYYIFTYWDKAKKTEQKKIKRIYTGVKIFASTITLAITVYSIYVGSEQLDFISLLLVVLSVITWIFHTVSWLAIMFLEGHKELLLNAFLLDVKPVTAPVNAVKSFVKRISGQDEPDELFGVSEKAKTKLDKLRARFVERKNLEREEKKRKRTEDEKEKLYK